MSIKIPSSTTAATAPAQMQKAEQSTSTRDSQATAQSGPQGGLQRDGFDSATRCRPPPHIELPPLGRKGETLSFGDRRTASNLKDTLSSPLNRLRVAMGRKDETITRNRDGSYSGPNGEPLAQVKLKDGTTAYVDPNTNRYYLTDEKVNPFTGRVQATGPYNLPKGAQFSNSHFSEADVKAIQRHAASGSPFDIQPWPPRPPIGFPPHLPIEPLPLPRLDPVILTGAALQGGGQSGE